MATDRPAFEPTPLDEADQTLHAIRRGAVDAFVVEEPGGHRVYALENTDLPYSVMVERMQQGAALLNESGEFLSCNASLAALVGVGKDDMIGKTLGDFLPELDWQICRRPLSDVVFAPRETEVQLRRSDGSEVAVKLSFLTLTTDKSVNALLVTDLTAERERDELSVALQRAQDEERRNIARELHDSVGQSLAAISMNIRTILRENYKIGPAATRAAEDSATLVEQIVKEIRSISSLLHPPLLELAGLASAIRWYVDGFSERSKIQVEVDIPADFPRVSDELDLALFRVVQECLTNVHRHSGSSWCSVKLTYDAEHLRIAVKDSGRGIPADQQDSLGTASLGLRGMRERLRQIGGTLKLRSDENGTTVEAVVPFPALQPSAGTPRAEGA